MSSEAAPDAPGVGHRLARIRADPRKRRLVIAGGLLVGLGLGSLHWLGLVLGGALVALPARSVLRGVAYGLGLGVLGLATFAVMLGLNGALGAALSTGTVGLIAVAVGLVAPLVGALTRAIV